MNGFDMHLCPPVEQVKQNKENDEQINEIKFMGALFTLFSNWTFPLLNTDLFNPDIFT
jgi:hypothetical protein